MKIVFNSPIKESLERVLTLLTGTSENLHIVCAEYKSTEHSSGYTEFAGLEIAKNFAENPDNVVILMSFMSKKGLFSHRPEMSGLLSFKNVAFLQLPPNLFDVIKTYRMLEKGEKKENTLEKLVFESEILDRTVSILRHDLKYAEQDPVKKEKWVDKATKAGFSGTFEKMSAAVQSWQRTSPGRFEGKHLEGVFVDFQGTLVVDGKLNKEVLDLVDRIKGDKPVCVITDGNLDDVSKELKRLGLEYPLMSKFELKGATLKIVIDRDFESQAEFQKEYGIIPAFLY